MKNKIVVTIGIQILLLSNLCAQTPNRSVQKIYEDSVQLAKYEKDDPFSFAQNILPIRLSDKSYFIKGFSSGLRVSNSELVDSVYRNYHANMPDTTTVKPYASFSVIGDKIYLDFIFHSMITNSKKYLMPELKKINSTKGIDKIFLPRKEAQIFDKDYSIKITTNGKVLIDWSNLVSTSSKTLYEEFIYFKDLEVSTRSYEYLYSLGTISLNKINDQILIEIRNDKTGWLFDSYNITRVALAPKITAFINPNTHVSFSYIENSNNIKKK